MPDKTVWVCHVDPTHDVRVEDIPIEQFADVEKRFDTSWLSILASPLRTSELAVAMYHKCAAIAGVEPKPLTAAQMLEVFELVDDDRPTMYAGGLPDPKAPESLTSG